MLCGGGLESQGFLSSCSLTLSALSPKICLNLVDFGAQSILILQISTQNRITESNECAS